MKVSSKWLKKRRHQRSATYWGQSWVREEICTKVFNSNTNQTTEIDRTSKHSRMWFNLYLCDSLCDCVSIGVCMHLTDTNAQNCWMFLTTYCIRTKSHTYIQDYWMCITDPEKSTVYWLPCSLTCNRIVAWQLSVNMINLIKIILLIN